MTDTEPQPITSHEVQVALGTLKLGKTSGATGMSNEFLVALGRVEGGMALLLSLLNTMLLQGNMPNDLLVGIACLVPKSPSITLPSQIRPILLLEVVQKLFASLLMRRLAPHWPPVHAQLGAIPGGQPVEALFAAQQMVNVVNVRGQEPLFLKLDIKGAFDNLRHASVADLLATLPAACCHEAFRLMCLLLGQKVRFSFLDAQWELHSSNGTPQGGSHSAVLFARTLDHAIGKLGATWETMGHNPAFDPIWPLLFVDDILLCFKDWAQAIALLPSFLDCLSTLGLEINFGKSCLVTNSRLSSTLLPSHGLELLKQFPWVEHTQYLRKPFGYNLPVDAIHQQAIQILFGAWGKLKPVLKRCSWQHPSTTVRMLDQYVASAFLWLSPTLYPYKTFRQRLRVAQTTLLIEALNFYIPHMTETHAHQFLRLRRHIVKRWLLHMAPAGGWEH